MEKVEFTPEIRLSIPCENGNCPDCTGWVSAPFCGPQRFRCPCTSCTHPDAWTPQQAEDEALALYYRKYPGETILLTSPTFRRHTIGTWPGSKPRPHIYWVWVQTQPHDPDRTAIELPVTLTEPTGVPEVDAATAARLAEEGGYHLVPSMGGQPYCAMRVDQLGWFRKQYYFFSGE